MTMYSWVNSLSLGMITWNENFSNETICTFDMHIIKSPNQVTQNQEFVLCVTSEALKTMIVRMTSALIHWGLHVIGKIEKLESLKFLTFQNNDFPYQNKNLESTCWSIQYVPVNTIKVYLIMWQTGGKILELSFHFVLWWF